MECNFREPKISFPAVDPSLFVELLFLFKRSADCEVNTGARFEMIIIEVYKFGVESVDTARCLRHDFIAVILAVEYNCVAGYTIPALAA